MRKDILDIGDPRVTDRLKIIFMSIAMDLLDLKIVLMISQDLGYEEDYPD